MPAADRLESGGCCASKCLEVSKMLCTYVERRSYSGYLDEAVGYAEMGDGARMVVCCAGSAMGITVDRAILVRRRLGL